MLICRRPKEGAPLKKCFTLILSVLLAFSAFGPLALADETYPNASYTLTETSIDLSGLPVYVQSCALESIGFESEPDAEGLVQIGAYEDFIKDHTLELRFASENLNTLIYRADNRGIIVKHEDRLIYCAANPARGALDANNTLLSVGAHFEKLNTRGGVILSPDGVYCAFVDCAKISAGRFEYQLILLDIRSGEYFYTQTWNTNVGEENVAGVVSAAFDETGSLLYYITLGNQNEAPYSLYSYSIETGESKLLSNHRENITQSNLLAVGSSLLLTPSSGTGFTDGIVTYTQNPEGIWETEFSALPDDSIDLLRLQASAESELALATLYFNGYQYLTEGTYISVFDTDKTDFSAVRVLIFNEEITECTSVSMGDLEDSVFIADPAAKAIYNACLTPDGKHALIIHDKQPHLANTRRDPHDYSWILLNLETLEIKNIDAPQALNSQFLRDQSPVPNDYPLGINMLSDSLVLINTENGVKLYELR